MPAASHILSDVGVMVPAAYRLVFTFEQGVAGLLQAINVASILSSGLLVLRFFYPTRRERAVMPQAAPSPVP